MADESIPVPSSDDATGDTSTEATTVAPGSFNGWNAWRTAVNYTLPQQLAAANSLYRSTLKVIGAS